MSFKKKATEDNAPALADDRDDPVAAPAASDSGRSGPALSKRAFLKGAATAPFAAAGAKYSVGRSRAAIGTIGVGVAVGTGVAAGYLVREAQDYFTGDSVSEGAYNQMEADQAHADAKSDAISMHEANETVLTTMSNLLANSQNAAFADAKYAAVEAMNLGKTKADVKAAAVPKVDTFFATQQKNLFNHFSVQAQTWVNIINSLEDTPNIGWNDVFIHPADGRNVDDGRPNDMGGKCQLATNSVTLVDGNDFTYNIAQWNYQNSGGYSKDSAVKPGGDPIKAFPVNTGSQTVVLDGPKWTSVRDSITSNHSNVVSEIETWIDGVYDSYNQGDIKLSELVDASTIADKAPDEQGYSYAGADLALMGLEGADHAYSIELMESGQVVQGTIYAQGRTDPLELGTVYSPGSISGTVWLAYETTDDSGNTVSDLVALEQNFQVLDGKNSEGESVTEVTFSPKNQQTTDTNVTNVTKELQQLQELQDELRKQQQQEVSSGGGGMSLDQFSIGSIPGAGVVAIFLGGALWLFGQDDN